MRLSKRPEPLDVTVDGGGEKMYLFLSNANNTE
jgi:hypothetical protein